QNLERVLRDLVTENAHLQSRVKAKDTELAAAQQQLRRNEEATEREMLTLRQELTRKTTEVTTDKSELTRKEVDFAETQQQLIQKETELTRNRAELTRNEAELTRKEAEVARKEAELTRKEAEVTKKEAEVMRAEETMRREQQQIQEMRQRETELVQAKDKEIALLQQQLGGKHSYTCQVSGPGLTSATVNQPTHILVQLNDSSGRPYSLPLNVTAQLELVSKATPTNPPEATPTSPPVVTVTEAMMPTSRWPWSKKPPIRYEMTYTPVSRGQHKLHVQVNHREINGSPFTVTVYPDPRQLGHPVRTVTGLNKPYGIAFNSHQEMIVSECEGHRVSIFDNRGQKIRTFGSHGDSPDQMEYPACIATR
ncbi:Reticulocyte-binding protein 2 homolog a, partial [Geodia barretti]